MRRLRNVAVALGMAAGLVGLAGCNVGGGYGSTTHVVHHDVTHHVVHHHVTHYNAPRKVTKKR